MEILAGKLLAIRYEWRQTYQAIKDSGQLFIAYLVLGSKEKAMFQEGSFVQFKHGKHIPLRVHIVIGYADFWDDHAD